jgi:fatty-acyl-CoA synthase
MADHELRIADDEGNDLSERFVGNVQFRGPSSMQGYYHNPKATAAAYVNGWWNSGDLGYIADGELFITGRKKDMIIKAGRNLYPEAIEEIVGNIPSIRRGCVIAFGVTDTKLGTEKIVIVAEVKMLEDSTQNLLEEEIVEKVSLGIGVPPDHVVLVPPRTIPKTSSGKLQRSACKHEYLSGQLTKPPRSVQWQMMQLFLSAAANRMRRFFKMLSRFVFTLYVVLIWGVTLIPVWIVALLSPKSFSAKIIKGWSKLLFKFSFCPIHVFHEKNLSQEEHTIFVANHASYTDAFVLLAILPAGTVFVGKKELLSLPIVSSIMRKLNYIAVDRWDMTQNLEDTKTIQQALEKHKSILIFPEGTFTYASGLQIFKAGAFQLAVDTQTVVCPIAIQNTRKLLRSGNYLFTRTPIKVTVCDLLIPTGKEWSDVNYLRQEARKMIAANCGEPVIDLIAQNPNPKN